MSSLAVRYPEALGLIEATWTTWNPGVAQGPIIYGSKGTLVVSRPPAPDGVRTPPHIEVYTSRGHGLTEPDEIVAWW